MGLYLAAPGGGSGGIEHDDGRCGCGVDAAKHHGLRWRCRAPITDGRPDGVSCGDKKGGLQCP